MHFLIRNKKPLAFLWLITAVIFTAMIFIVMPFLGGTQPTKEEQFFVIGLTAIGFPLFICLIMYVKSAIYTHKLNKNRRYEPFALFFKQHNFRIIWVDTDSFLTISEKAVVGKLLDKNIICRIDEKHMDRMDFVIYGLNPEKTKANRSYIRNLFDLEEPRFYEGLMYKSFNRTKTLTTETLTLELETLIRAYE